MAVCPLDQAYESAVMIHLFAAVGRNPRKAEEFCRVCAGSCQSTVCSRLVPTSTAPLSRVVAQSFVREEPKQPVLQDRSTGSGSPVVEPVLVLYGAVGV